MSANDHPLRPQLKDFDLSPVNRTLESRGVKHPQHLEREFRRFLELVLEYPQENLHPPLAVERYWRECVAHTALYRRLCDEVLGDFLEFEPGLSAETRDQRVDRTRDRYREHFEEEPPGVWQGTHSTADVSEYEVVTYLKFRGDWEPTLERLRGRNRGIREARERGIEVTLGELQDGANTFRRRHDLESREETQRWLDRNGVTLEEFEQFVEEELLLYKFQRQLARDAGLRLEALEPEYEDALTDLLFDNWLASTGAGRD